MEKRDNVIDQRVVLLQRHWKNAPSVELPAFHAQKPESALTIAISREVGSLGSEVARELGKRLDWPVYDREILELISKRSILRTELLGSIDEQSSHWLNEFIRSVGHPEEMSRAGYVYHLTKVLAALAAHGKCVIVGRGAAAMLPTASTLKVRIIAPLELRIDRMAQSRKIPRTEAKALVNRLDLERRQFVHGYFHRDVDDPHTFDMVLNSEHFTATEMAEMAWVAVQTRQLGYSREAAVGYGELTAVAGDRRS